ncbi:hypothetical protein BJ742DRAFT_912911 [Cladochytrium replicatum]|nr:hypothetical protein BJ742DRAFT_912911 [Cladochytrium replicatum]
MVKDPPPPKSPAGTESSFEWEARSVVSKGTYGETEGACWLDQFLFVVVIIITLFGSLATWGSILVLSSRLQCDRIEIHGQAFIVKEFRLMNTVLKRALRTKSLAFQQNHCQGVRRSGAMSEKISFFVSREGTTFTMLKELQARLLSFAESNQSDYDVRWTRSWMTQDDGLMGRRRISFMAALQNAIMDVGIKVGKLLIWR